MNKQTINYDVEDIIQSQIRELMLWWMKNKQPDETKKIEEYVRREHEREQSD